MVLTLNWTDEELENKITEVLSNITGLDPNKGEIRLAYNQQGQPGWRHTDTVVAYYIRPYNDPYGEDITDNYSYNDKHDNFDKDSVFTRVMECRISCYGPKHNNLSTLIWGGIQSDENRLNLSKVNIFPIPKISPPEFVPYEFNKQWWLRSDVSILFNVYTKISSQVNSIESAEIKVITKEEGEINVNITPKTSS